ncbi:protein kinase [Actinomadura sp. NEAU-AAG7]|uniref:protein kinase domain-containing protein n=1 Tax=Actinomadura sp. NEAU-AAG7 TaxID=2839640 RepID=UPI001BE42BF3|nr:protein kinase [Actinomadura sp. NEAU-AAG7]MBT2213285.1 protein kinase [Actinomadura sp. NEAU-AAG7]
MKGPLGSKYILEEVIGRGATGEVWRGRTHEGERLAFKLLHDTLARDPETVNRFLREGSILSGVVHPHLVRVHDLVVEGATLAIVMDLVEGSDLRAPLAAHGAMRPGDACAVAAETASALAAVHDAGVVHRDVKPENVLLDGRRTPPAVRLTDFGIARIAEQTGSKSTMLVGTAPYIAPELADGQPPTPATDLYALGIMLYEMCCGVTPFADRSTLVMLQHHGHSAPGRPPGMPGALWELIVALLAKDPAARPAPAGRVAILLEALARDLEAVPAAETLTEPPAPVAALHDADTALSMRNPGRDSGGTEPAGRRGGRRGRRGRTLAIAAVTAAVVCAVAAGAYAATRDPGSDTGPGPGPTTVAKSGGGPAPESPPPSSARASYGPNQVPDLVGMPETQARALLPPSVGVQIRREAAPSGSPDGVVLAQDPKPGADLPTTLQLTVSSKQAIQYLADIEPSAGDTVRTGTEAANLRLSGHPQLHAIGVEGSPCGNETGSVEYDLGQHYTRLQGLAGLDDNSPAAKAQVTVEFYGDARKLKSITTTLGKSQDLEVDVRGVLRLTLRWTFSGGDASRCDGGTLVLGDAQLVAAAGYVPPSTESPTPTLPGG